MDSNLEGKQGGPAGPPALTLADLLYKEGRGAQIPLEAAAPYPPAHHLLLHQTLAAPLFPGGLPPTPSPPRAAEPPSPRDCATISSPSPLAWLGEASHVEIVIITTTPSCC